MLDLLIRGGTLVDGTGGLRRLGDVGIAGDHAIRLAASVTGRDVTEAQLRQMTGFVAEAMDAGALGMSTGLEFEPGRLAGAEELQALVGVVGAASGLYASHIRNRDAALQAAVDEFLGLIEGSGAGGQISHLNVRDNTGAAPGAWERAVETLGRARAGGLDVLADATPLTSGYGVAAAILPRWLTDDGQACAAERLRDWSVPPPLPADCDRDWRVIQ